MAIVPLELSGPPGRTAILTTIPRLVVFLFPSRASNDYSAHGVARTLMRFELGLI